MRPLLRGIHDPRVTTAVGVGLTVLVVFLCIHHTPPFWNQDTAHYLSIGEHLARGDGYRSSVHIFDDHLQPPLYPMLLALGVRLGATAVHAAMAIAVLASAFTTIGVVRLHSLLTGGRGSLAAALVAAVQPNVAIAAHLVLEPLFVCLVTWSTVLTFEALQRSSIRRALGGGGLLAAALVTRSEVVIPMFVLASLVIGYFPLGRDARVRLVGALLAPTAFVALAYGLWMKSAIGSFIVLPKIVYNLPLAETLRTIAWAPDEVLAPHRIDRISFALMPDHVTFVLDHAFRHPGFDAASMFPRSATPAPMVTTASVREVISAAVFGLGVPTPIAALMMGVAIVAVARDRPKLGTERRLLTLAMFVLVLATFAPALFSGEDFSPRFLAAPLAYSLPLASAGAVWAIDRLSTRRPFRAAPSLVAVVIASLVIGSYGSLTRRMVLRPDREGARIDAVARACAEHLPAGARVLSDRNRYAFERGGHAFMLPFVRSVDELREHIAGHQIDYAVLDSQRLSGEPGSVYRDVLLDPARWPADWRLVAEVGSNTDVVRIVALR